MSFVFNQILGARSVKILRFTFCFFHPAPVIILWMLVQLVVHQFRKKAILLLLPSQSRTDVCDRRDHDVCAHRGSAAVVDRGAGLLLQEDLRRSRGQGSPQSSESPIHEVSPSSLCYTGVVSHTQNSQSTSPQ